MGKVCELSGVGKMGKVCEWSEVARWERWENSEMVRRERWENSEVAQSERWERNEMAIWDKGRVVSREGGMEFKGKIVLHCSREAKYKQGFTAGIL